MTAHQIVRVTDTSTRAELVEAIEVLRARQRRLPVHFVEARDDLADEVDLLVERVLGMDRA